MPRLMLTDKTWSLLTRVMSMTGRIYNKPQHRMTLEGILYRMRTGIPWRDLPREFGCWSKVFHRFNTWSRSGVMDALFHFLSKRCDTEWLFLDGSIVKAHQDASTVGNAQAEAIGASRGGKTTKIHLAVDSGGLPVHFEITGGQQHDVTCGQSLIEHSPEASVVIADRGYDSDALRLSIEKRSAAHVIPRKRNSRRGNGDIDWCLYGYRHLVENAFLKIKKYRAIATRYDKTARNYSAMVSLAFTMMWLPMWVD